MNKILTLLAFALFTISTANAQVFKCKNAVGATEYSDRPCANAQAIRIDKAPDVATTTGGILDTPDARALRAIESEQRHKNPPSECRFSYSSAKGKILAINAKEECLHNLDLKAVNIEATVSTKNYNLWRDYRGIEAAEHNSALIRQNYVGIRQLQAR